MKQILQSYQTGQTEIVDVPMPAVKRGHVLIRSHRTLISSGTERSLIQSSRKSLFTQAIEQPERIRKAIDRVQSDGLLSTVESIQSRSKQLQSLGYCNVGEVIEVGDGVLDFKIGDRVVSNGPHAEFVCVPVNLCAKVPDGVADDEAVFTVLGAIALQGVRLLNPSLGECFAVLGLGSIGLLSVQILRANGCRVLAMDFSPERLAMAETLGAQTFDLNNSANPLSAAQEFSRGNGVDGVLITAATDSNEPLHQAATICRRRGRIVLTGVIGPELSRTDFYEKEISFQVSCSYGPGRYDPVYEQQGVDYPLAYVRWTEQRNFVAFLDLLAESKVSAAKMISHRFPVERAADAYATVTEAKASLGIVLTYASAAPSSPESRRVKLSAVPFVTAPAGQASVSIVGAGNYGSKVLIPAFRKAGANLVSVADRGGLASWISAHENGANEATTEIDPLFTDPRINSLVFATRHDTHAGLVCKALRAGKNVFVEKPLALNEAQLQEIEKCYLEVGGKSGGVPLLMVGFNRRFAPHVIRIHELLKDRHEPLAIQMTVNAGAIPAGHWVHDLQAGGGRLIGEGCHFVDLMRFLTGAKITRIQTQSLSHSTSSLTRDKVTVLLSFEDGSMGTLNYLANGHLSYPKEQIEIFCGGRVFKIENFVRARAYGQKGFHSQRLWRQDKGQAACAAAFVEAVCKGQPSPIPFEELVDVARATFQINDQLK